MKKIKNFALILLMLIFSFNLNVSADELSGGDNWNVEFTSGKQMVSNFSTGSFVDVLDDMQPGDTANFKVTIKNSYSLATDWYMTNEVIESLEDAVEVAQGGGYTYLLVYHYPENRNQTKKVRVLYDNYDVGGEGTIDTTLEGLYEATDSLKDYFYLDTLYSGETGYISLEVSLDGETQGNDYQDTLAQLQMNFAVELPSETTTETVTNSSNDEVTYQYVDGKKETVVIQEPDTYVQDEDTIKIVHTGDDTNLIALYVAAFILALLLIILAIIGMKIRKDMKNENKKKSDKSVRLLALAIFAGYLFASSFETNASGYSGYTYTVRIFSGEQGTFESGSNLVTLEGIAPGTKVDLTDLISSINLTQNAVYTINEDTGEKEVSAYETKYSVRGVRESGRDNDEVGGEVFYVYHDMDVVVAYKINGGDTPYTVKYVDAETGEELCDEETFYGYVGERIVVSYKYFEGYSPQDTYNYSFVIKNSSSGENVNYVTFKYVKSSASGNSGEGSSTGNSTVIYINGENETTYEYIPGTVIHVAGNEKVIVIHDGNTNADDESVDDTDNTVVDTIDLDPEDSPLSDGGALVSVIPTLLNILDKSPIGYLLSPDSVMRGYLFMGCLICIGIIILIILWVCFHNAESRERVVVFFTRRKRVRSKDSDLYQDILIEQMLDEKDEEKK